MHKDVWKKKKDILCCKSKQKTLVFSGNISVSWLFNTQKTLNIQFFYISYLTNFIIAFPHTLRPGNLYYWTKNYFLLEKRSLKLTVQNQKSVA